jgi:predicted GNAT family acetyltransferase
MAAVAALAMRDVAPVVTLYVNAHNASARRCYEHVGFTQTCRFTTILF